MTTPARVYEDLRFDQLLHYSTTNPNRRRRLEPIELRVELPSEESTLDGVGLQGYVSTSLNPTGVLGVLQCIENPAEYGLLQKNERIQRLGEQCTALQADTDSLKNTSLARSRKKLYDCIAVSYHQGLLQEKDYLLLYQGIGHLRNLQFVLLREAVQQATMSAYAEAKAEAKAEDAEDAEAEAKTVEKGSVLFSSDPFTWKRDHPVWVVDHKGQWVAVPTALYAQSMETRLATWLPWMEEKGWTIEWPAVDGTKAELVQELRTYPSWTEADAKSLKDVLSRRLGKERAMAVFREWSDAAAAAGI